MLFPALCQRKSGKISVEKDKLDFSYDDTQEVISILYSDLRVSSGGENQPILIFSSSQNPELTISTPSLDIIDHLSHRGFDAIHSTASRIRSRHTWRYSIMAICASILIVAFLILPFLASRFPDAWLDRLLSPETEYTLFHKIDEATSFNDDPLVDSQTPAVSKLQSLVDFIKSKSPSIQNFKIDVRISESQEVNAAAYPGCILVVNAGLIAHAESIEEIAGIVGHELGHIERRHVIKSLGSSLGLIFGALIVGSIAGSDAAAWMMKGLNFTQLKYSRDYEREADESAARYLHSAGISTDGLIKFLGRLSRVDLPAIFSIASTHPISAERVLNLRQISASLGDLPEPATLPVKLDDLR